MKEKDLRDALQTMYGEVPDDTHAAFMAALRPERKETVVKKKLMYTPVLAIVLVLLLATVAVAATSQVLEWYYANRFTAIDPAMRDSILTNAKAPLTQTQDENDLFDASVQEVSFAAEEKLLVITLNVAPKAPESTELHPMWNLDADGSYVGGDAPLGTGDDEDRGDHWLWTKKGFGPVKDMMLDPDKTLYLVETGHPGLELGWHGDANCVGLAAAMDAFTLEDGSVQFVFEYQMDELTEAYEKKVLNNTALTEDEAAKRIANLRAQREVIQRGGELLLSIPYFTVDYREDDAYLYLEGKQPHYVDLTIDIGSIPADFFK